MELIASIEQKLEKYFVLFCYLFVLNLKPWVTQKHCPPVHEPDPPTDLVHRPLYGPVHRPSLYVPPIKSIIKMTIRDLTYRLFCFVFCYCCLLRCGDERRTSKKTDNLANLRIRCQPPVASAILFGSMFLMFSDSSQTSKIRHSISLFLSHATMDGMGLQISWKYISVVYKFSSTLQKEYIWITGLPHFCVARYRLPNLICLSNQIKTLIQTLCFCSV